MTYENAFRDGVLDTFDWDLAEALGWGSVERMHDGMSNLEYLSWRALHVYRNAKHELAMQEVKAQRRGR